MRILIVTQYFAPEPIFKGLPFAKELVRQGHQVEVLTGFPNYPGGKIFPGYRVRFLQREVIEGIPIVRVPIYPSHDTSAIGRILSYLSFAFTATIMGPWVVGKPDLISASHGNATIGLPAWFLGHCFGVPYVLDIDDLWPDSITVSGMLPRHLAFLITWVDVWCRFMYRHAAKIGVLSKGLKRILEERGVPASKVEVILNWCDEVQTLPSELPTEERDLFSGRFNVVMAGNMGRMQGLEIVLDAAAELATQAREVQFLLVGGGVERSNLEANATRRRLGNVKFLPRRPVEEIGAVLHRADALLVHLRHNPLFEVTIPSRIQAYLAVGRPILCGVKGDAADLVQEAGAGLVFEPENPRALVEAVLAMLRMSQPEREAMGQHGRRFYQERCSIPVATASFADLFARAVE